MNIAQNMRWAERTKRAREKNAAHDAAAQKRSARAAHQMAIEAEGQRLAEEQVRREGSNRVFCPVCDGEGRLTPEQAERAYRAFERLASDSKPDTEVLDTLRTIARGDVPHRRGPHICAGVSHPRRAATETVAEPAKAEKRSFGKVLPVPETLDGALIEP